MGKINYWGGGHKLFNDTSKNPTSPPYLVKNERSLTPSNLLFRIAEVDKSIFNLQPPTRGKTYLAFETLGKAFLERISRSVHVGYL